MDATAGEVSIRSKRDAAQSRVSELQQLQNKLIDQIDKATAGIRRGTSLPAASDLNKLGMAKHDCDVALRVAEAELRAAEAAFERAQREKARDEFTQAVADMHMLRTQIVTLMREAADKYGALIALQRRAPGLANACGNGLSSLPDQRALAELGQPIDPYSDRQWIGSRQFVLVEIGSVLHSVLRVRPVVPL